ncbi:26S proteasome non-ATPase regulatory subunit 4-like [Coregonus clupeaformis]|uniref:26S proteasome non-ATPase regulatory subunit 4-like n=1 Tax=Coregonus clupeaformis TaxID=59861 RepID=UPI001BE008A1|nr:26S proteasome non-ATPase regulatory subunit 4-like [Coregonus clupeaformis]
MKEQRPRQEGEEEARRVAVASAADVTTADESEEALLKVSVSHPETGAAAVLPDCSNMTEEEQISLAREGAPIDTETAKEDDDYDVIQDPEFLQSVLENLPGVDPNNEAIRNAMGSLASQTGPPKPDSKKDEEKKK